jgi:probable HAF family extracellular repeat protein
VSRPSGQEDGSNDHAVLWEHGRITDLGTLGGTFSIALEINERGQVVGESKKESGLSGAFLWQDGTMVELGTVPDAGLNGATGINNRGQIVGVGGGTAVLWTRK